MGIEQNKPQQPVKTLRITFRKDGRAMTATLRYRLTEWPESVELSGETEYFLMSDGKPSRPKASLGQLAEVAAWQAAQIGASAEIEDLGGEAGEWRDEVR